MGRRFNKKNAQTFSIVHRAHDDALFYDNEASGHVLVPLKGGNQKKSSAVDEVITLSKKKVFSTSELEKQLDKDEINKIRGNEGLAAQFGIYFDDSKYDYMQHLKPIGDDHEGVFISKDSNKQEKEKPKSKDIGDLFGDQVPSERKRNVAFDEGQNIPTELKGFNPDMDPRLREVLEALEDEEYLERRKGEEDRDIEGYEDDDDDLFADLLGSGEVEHEDEFYYGSDADQYYDDDYDEEYDEWDLDNYKDEYDAKYNSDNQEEEKQVPVERDVSLLYNAGEAPEEAEGDAAPVSFISSNWELDFHKFKAENKKKENEWDSDNEFDDEEEDQFDVVGDLPSIAQTLKKGKSKNKLRKKKGAMSDTSEFSMSSSALFRTEGLTLLDDRYEQLAKKFEDEDEEEEEYQEFDMALERQDLEGMLDDFLENYEMEKGGRKLVKKNETRHRIQEAADSVSKGKVAAKRKKEREMKGLGSSFGGLTL